MQRSSSNRRQSPRALIEGLEGRQLLSAAVPQIEAKPLIHVLPFVTNTTPKGMTPAQIRHAYGFDNITFSGGIVGDGSGQTIAIVDAYDDPYISSDLAKFNTTFGLPSSPFSVVKTTTRISVNAGWATETSLDVEWAHAIAPKASIVLVEARSSGLGDLLKAVDTARKITAVSAVSTSWGAGEFSSESSYDSYFAAPAGHSNISFIASSGDSGAPVEWPSVSPNVVAVGGTTLSLDSSGNYSGETGWSGSTGGISKYVAKPSYQSGLTLSPTFRTVPDIAYDADPNSGVAVYDSVTYNGTSGWFQVGGTSAGAPQIAAMIAIADQGRAINHVGTLDSRTQLLPALYSAPSSNFNDVLTGTSTGSPHYSAASGYDLVTGIGTPKPDSLVQQLLATL